MPRSAVALVNGTWGAPAEKIPATYAHGDPAGRSTGERHGSGACNTPSNPGSHAFW
jgi:hypothetical protein